VIPLSGAYCNKKCLNSIAPKIDFSILALSLWLNLNDTNSSKMACKDVKHVTLFSQHSRIKPTQVE
jgi:hypothetical protein